MSVLLYPPHAYFYDIYVNYNIGEIMKNIIIAFFISVAMFGIMPVMAKEKTQTLADVIDLSKQTLKAMQNNLDKNQVLSLLKAAKQASKSVVISGSADVKKQRGSTRIKRARRAYRDGKTEEAKQLMNEAINYYKEAKAAHFN